MDDYCFRKIKSSALVMIALAAVHIAISRPLGYYWNALQAELSGVELTVKGVPEASASGQGMVVSIFLFGTIAVLAFITSPRRTNIFYRLILLIPLSIYLYSAYAEYEKISPISEKFKDLYESLEYAIFVPYAALAAFTALYLIFVITLPAFRVTQAFGWVTSVMAILSYLASAVFIIYNHTMTILEGTFGEGEFYIYLVAFALDVTSYFFMLSVLMTYSMIKREERWDRLEALELAREAAAAAIEEEAEERAIYEPPAPSAHPGERVIPAAEVLKERVIPDIEDMREHETSFFDDYERYRQPARAADMADKAGIADKADIVGKADKADLAPVAAERAAPATGKVAPADKADSAAGKVGPAAAASAGVEAKSNKAAAAPVVPDTVIEKSNKAAVAVDEAIEKRNKAAVAADEADAVFVVSRVAEVSDDKAAAVKTPVPDAASTTPAAPARPAASTAPAAKSGRPAARKTTGAYKDPGAARRDEREKKIVAGRERSVSREEDEKKEPAPYRDPGAARRADGREETGRDKRPDFSRGRDEVAPGTDEYREEGKETVVADRARRNSAGARRSGGASAPARKNTQRKPPRKKK
jgi:hypothetical protein